MSGLRFSFRGPEVPFLVPSKLHILRNIYNSDIDNVTAPYWTVHSLGVRMNVVRPSKEDCVPVQF